MTDIEQKKIFSRNLSDLVSSSGRMKMDIAHDLGFNERTFSGWCNGVAMPSHAKIRRLAEYFRVSPSDLLGESEADIYKLSDKEINLVKCFRQLSEDDQDILIGDIKRTLRDNRLAQKGGEENTA